MEMFGWNVPLWLILIFVVLFVYYKYMTATFNIFKNSPGLRGPKPVIIAGTMAEVGKKGFSVYDRELIEKYGKVVTHFQGRAPALLVADLDMLKEIQIKQHWSFNERTPIDLPPPLDSIVGLMKGDRWKHVRGLLSPAFSTGKLRRMNTPINQCCETLVNNLREKAKSGEAIDIRLFASAFTMDVTAKTGFGLDLDSQSDPDNPFVKHAQKTILENMSHPLILLVGFFPFLSKYFAKMGLSYIPKSSLQFFSRIIEKAMQNRTTDDESRTDFLQLMINAHNDDEYIGSKEGSDHKGPLTINELTAQGIGFFMAGYDFSANSLSFVLFCLASNPDVQEKVAREIQETMEVHGQPTYDIFNKMKYLDMVVSEVLRMYTPTARADRVSQHDITINGVFIPKGVIINVPIDYLHHDPDVYSDPYKFDPERFTEETKAERHPMSYQPFGSGPRQCTAARLSVMELKMATVAILKNVRVQLTSETPIPPKRNKMNGRPIGMMLQFEERIEE